MITQSSLLVKIDLCLGFSNTSRVESLDRFGKVVIEKVNDFILMLNKRNGSLEY